MSAMAQPQPSIQNERQTLHAAACLFKSLGDPGRLMIVRRLAQSDLKVTELVDQLGLAQSTVSKHLRCLRDCGLVTATPEGAAARYHLACPELLHLLSSTEALLAQTGDAVALCPTSGLIASATRT